MDNKTENVSRANNNGVDGFKTEYRVKVQSTKRKLKLLFTKTK